MVVVGSVIVGVEVVGFTLAANHSTNLLLSELLSNFKIIFLFSDLL